MSVMQFTSINYPESDGKPMGETDVHIKQTVRLRQLLERFFAGQRVYVSGNLLVFYEQGNPKKFFVPDVFVVKDLKPGDRRFYKLWVERRPPSVVIEVTSRKTKRQDTVVKPELCRRLGVPEYFLFDPAQEYLDPPLQGFRLLGEHYEAMASAGEGGMESEQLGLRLCLEGEDLALYRVDTGERLLTAEESLQVEAEARRAAEAEVARLREELGRRARKS